MSNNIPDVKANSTQRTSPQAILTLNAGSSSIKFALFRVAEPLLRVLSGKFERIGLADATFRSTPNTCPPRSG